MFYMLNSEDPNEHLRVLFEQIRVRRALALIEDMRQANADLIRLSQCLKNDGAMIAEVVARAAVTREQAEAE